MTTAEAIAYAQQLLKDSGAPDEEVTQVAKLFGREKFAQGFIARPEVDRSLDAERQKSKAHAERNDYLENTWLPSAKRAEEQAKNVYAKFQRYQQLYGDIDESNPADVRRAAADTGLTADQVRELLSKEMGSILSANNAATLDLMKIQNHHFERFKKALPIDDLEAHVAEVRKRGNSDSLMAIYKDWIGDQVDKASPHRFSDDDLKARDKRIAEDAVKDFASRNHVPVDSRPKEAHLLFDNATLKAEKAKANGGDKSGRDAFLEVLSDPDPETVRQRYPV